MKIIFYLLCVLTITQAFILDFDTLDIQSRIISGTPAKLGQFPWQVTIKKDEVDTLWCGGSIISDIWVLTAGHCTHKLSSVFMLFGTIKLDDSDALSMTSNSLFLHENYDSLTLKNDVSLIKLPIQLSFSDSIKPIRLVSSAQINNDFLGTNALISGYGLTDDEYTEASDILLFAGVRVIDNKDCEAVFGNQRVINSTMCALSADGGKQSICSGDSGGALVAQDNNGDYIQIGINSFVVEDECTAGLPSAYARLTSFLDFISHTTGLNLS